MTENEAIKILQEEKTYMDDHAGRAQSEAFQTVINSLEKQIPKKPTKDKYVPELDFCPECGTEVTNCNYCPYCGQKIKVIQNDNAEAEQKLKEMESD